MRGHRELIAARLQGYAPSLVFLELDFGRIPLAVDQVQIEETDRLSSIDLRCVRGLNVSVSGVGSLRVKQIAQAAIHAGAMRVLTFVSAPKPNGTNEITEMTDTDGSYVWKK